MSPATIRLGTASPSTQASTPETIAQLEQIARRAASKKIDILLLPEAYIGGYPRGTHFGCVIGSRTAEGREEYLRYFQNAVDLGDTVGDGAGAGEAWIKRALPGDAVPGSNENSKEPAANKRGDGTREQLERIARETGVFIVTGLIEKTGGSMYCSVVYVCPKQGIIGKRRKVMPVSYPFLTPFSFPILTPQTDRHRTPGMGSRLPSHPPRSKHHHPRRPHQPRRSHLLGELHAFGSTIPLQPKHQPLPRPHR